MELFFLTFPVANSLMKAEFRRKDLVTDYTSQRLYWIWNVCPEEIMYKRSIQG